MLGDVMSRSWSRNIELDPGTFGNTPACHILVDMMNNDVIPVFEKHRVLSFLTATVVREYKGIASIKDHGVRISLMYRSRDAFVKRINLMPYPKTFLSFLRNVVYGMARKYLEEI
jgi:hypothetical protein